MKQSNKQKEKEKVVVGGAGTKEGSWQSDCLVVSWALSSHSRNCSISTWQLCDSVRPTHLLSASLSKLHNSAGLKGREPRPWVTGRMLAQHTGDLS